MLGTPEVELDFPTERGPAEETEREFELNIETPDIVTPPRVEVMFVMFPPELLPVVQLSFDVSWIGLKFLQGQ